MGIRKNSEYFPHVSRFHIGQIEALIQLINVTRALKPLDVRRPTTGVELRATLVSIASRVSDHRLQRILSDDAIAKTVTPDEAVGLLGELIVDHRLQNPAKLHYATHSRHSSNQLRGQLATQHARVLRAIDFVARSKPVELAAAIGTAEELLQIRQERRCSGTDFVQASTSRYISDVISLQKCSCIQRQIDASLQGAQISSCGVCPDCRDGKPEPCLHRATEVFLNDKRIEFCADCKKLYAVVNAIDESLRSGLQDVIFPIVEGLSGVICKRGGNAFTGLTRPDAKAALSAEVAAVIFCGACVCEVDAERMKRKGNCCGEHSIHGWNSTDCSLLRYLYVAVTGMKMATNIERVFAMPVVPSELQAFSYTTCHGKDRALRTGVLVRHVGPHLESFGFARKKLVPKARIASIRVYTILKCMSKKCKQEVTLDNKCTCTHRGERQWPDTREATYVLDVDGRRTAEFSDGTAIQAYRVLPNQEECLHSKNTDGVSLDKLGAPLLFPVGISRCCPSCGNRMSGAGTGIELPKSHVDENPSDRHSAAPKMPNDDESSFPETDLLDFLLDRQHNTNASRGAGDEDEQILTDGDTESTKIELDLLDAIPQLVSEIDKAVPSPSPALRGIRVALQSMYQQHGDPQNGRKQNETLRFTREDLAHLIIDCDSLGAKGQQGLTKEEQRLIWKVFTVVLPDEDT